MKLSELIRGFLADNSLSSHPRQVSLVEYAEVMEHLIEQQGRENAELKMYVEKLRLAALNAISFMSGGVEKAELRDVYDATPEQCLANHNRNLLEAAADYMESHTSTSKSDYELLMEFAKLVGSES
jgi:hypothetical protein